jgi:hypothetical protein
MTTSLAIGVVLDAGQSHYGDFTIEAADIIVASNVPSLARALRQSMLGPGDDSTDFLPTPI